AICGTHFGGTKLVTSMRRKPAPDRRSTSAILSAAGIRRFSFCSPSRGPTSKISTCGIGHLVKVMLIDRITPGAGKRAAIGRPCRHAVAIGGKRGVIRGRQKAEHRLDVETLHTISSRERGK